MRRKIFALILSICSLVIPTVASAETVEHEPATYIAYQGEHYEIQCRKITEQEIEQFDLQYIASHIGIELPEIYIGNFGQMKEVYNAFTRRYPDCAKVVFLNENLLQDEEVFKQTFTHEAVHVKYMTEEALKEEIFYWLSNKGKAQSNLLCECITDSIAKEEYEKMYPEKHYETVYYSGNRINQNDIFVRLMKGDANELNKNELKSIVQKVNGYLIYGNWRWYQIANTLLLGVYFFYFIGNNIKF